MAAGAHPVVGVGIDAEAAQRVPRQHPARERVVAVERHAGAAQLLGRRRAGPRGDQQVGAVPGAVLVLGHRRRERLDRRAGVAHARVRQAAHEEQRGGARDDLGQLGQRRLAQRRDRHAGLVGEHARHRLVVRPRDLAEEAVDGELGHRRRVAASRPGQGRMRTCMWLSCARAARRHRARRAAPAGSARRTRTRRSRPRSGGAGRARAGCRPGRPSSARSRAGRCAGSRCRRRGRSDARRAGRAGRRRGG